MKELKDIILKKDDIVYYTDSEGSYGKVTITCDDNGPTNQFFMINTITKIVRPHYGTLYEAPKQILDQKEKEYLEAVIRPFRDRVLFISKHTFFNRPYEWLKIKLKDEELNIEDFDLPNFNEHTMYKGIELDKEYTLDELGLFKE